MLEVDAKKPQGRQQAAVQSDANCLLVIAPPGCGKTEVLAMRAEHLLAAGRIRPNRRILAMTFTNRARDNLRNRLREQLGENRLRTSVLVANFHELSARIVEAHYRTIELTPGFTYPRPAWLRRALSEITSDRARHRQAKDVLGSLKRQPLTDAQLIDRIRETGNTDALVVEKRRREDNYVDFGDLLRYTQLLLRNERISSLFQLHFDAILVDEFQDLSLQQYEITRQVCSRNITYVGDPHQGIFGWAGADPVNVLAHIKSRADETIDLDVNFRSSPSVLRVINSVSSSLGSAPLHAADPDKWESGDHAYAVQYPSDSDEAAGIVSLTDYLADKCPEDTIGVICRAEYRRTALDSAYESAQFTPQFWDYALDNPRVTRLLKRYCKHVDAVASFQEQVDELRERATESFNPADVDGIAEVHEACEQLMQHADRNASLFDLMNRLRDTTTSAITAGAHVLNAHVGKGQQFDWVVVMGLEEGHVPSAYSTTPSKILEDQRILLVMLSRARKGLFLTCARSNRNQYGRIFHNEPSRWWLAMESSCSPLPPAVAEVMQVV